MPEREDEEGCWGRKVKKCKSNGCVKDRGGGGRERKIRIIMRGALKMEEGEEKEREDKSGEGKGRMEDKVRYRGNYKKQREGDETKTETEANK